MAPQETQLYYLQSRYYDPEVGRFINADAFVATGQGLVGNNMFAYCNNNPVSYGDISGKRPERFDNAILETYVGQSESTIKYRLTIELSQQAKAIDRYIGEYVSGRKSITKTPVVDNLLAANKIRADVVKIKNAIALLLVPDPTPVNDVAAVGIATYAIISIVWNIVDLLIPVEDE